MVFGSFFSFSDSLLFYWTIIPCEWPEATLLYSFTLWLIQLIMIDTLHSSISSYLSIDSWHFVSLCLQVQPPTLPPYRPQFHNFFTSPCCSGNLCIGPMQLLSVLTLVLPRHMLLQLSSAKLDQSIPLQQSQVPEHGRSCLISNINCSNTFRWNECEPSNNVFKDVVIWNMKIHRIFKNSANYININISD